MILTITNAFSSGTPDATALIAIINISLFKTFGSPHSLNSTV